MTPDTPQGDTLEKAWVPHQRPFHELVLDDTISPPALGSCRYIRMQDVTHWWMIRAWRVTDHLGAAHTAVELEVPRTPVSASAALPRVQAILTGSRNTLKDVTVLAAMIEP